MNPRQLQFVNHYLVSGNGTDAARRAGYSEKNAGHHARTLLLSKRVQAELQKHRDQLQKQTQYDLAQAFQDAVNGAEFAKAHKNAMALHKFIELKAKLHGLLVEKHEVDMHSTVDIGRSLERMQAALDSTYGGREVTPVLVEAPAAEAAPPRPIDSLL